MFRYQEAEVLKTLLTVHYETFHLLLFKYVTVSTLKAPDVCKGC